MHGSEIEYYCLIVLFTRTNLLYRKKIYMEFNLATGAKIIKNNFDIWIYSLDVYKEKCSKF